MYGLFTLASPPAIVRVDGEDFTLKHPDNYKDLGEDERSNIEKEIKKKLAVYPPVLLPAVSRKGTNESIPDQALRRLLGHRRHSPVWSPLMKIQRRWGFLDIEEPIPHKFSDEELNAQTDGAAKFNELQDFWDMISNLVDRCTIRKR
ncbi:uncharacterized protein PADG_01409 [Paracoccidioides brasiliensis Pb18]|uniref:Uncharacterized protein n=1 Tax=Paracoccidioides brasiliensis (strain Pb18) TaxID=502780 RepID=C1G393_PARBD|nr:uncharacterized protein PADG_01409 [Paracoccidioides brasiliensis Pb18]EEH45259.2 hypothetical protein PADG_01409 [Paracoccidioides brasiliensis Pb18]